MRVVFTTTNPNGSALSPAGKLAEAELVFDQGEPLAGLRLIGFSIWQGKRGGRNVTFPARQYSVNGERRSFSLVRPTSFDEYAHDNLRDRILDEFKAHERATQAEPVTT